MIESAKKYLKYRGLRILVRDSKEFKEEEHKRDEKGRFAKMNGEKTDSTVHSMVSPQVSNENVVNVVNSVIAGVVKETGQLGEASFISRLPAFIETQLANKYISIKDKESVENAIEKFIDRHASIFNFKEEVIADFVKEHGIVDKICESLNLGGKSKAEKIKKYPKEKINIPTDIKNGLLKKHGIPVPDNFLKLKTVDGTCVYASEKDVETGKKLFKDISFFNEQKQKMASLYGIDDLPQKLCVLPMVDKAVACVSDTDPNTMYINADVLTTKSENMKNVLLHEYQHSLLRTLVKEKKNFVIGSALHEFASMVMASTLDGKSGFETTDINKIINEKNKDKTAYYFGQNFGTWFYEKFGHEGFMDLLVNSRNRYIHDALNGFGERYDQNGGFSKLVNDWITERFPEKAKDGDFVKKFIERLEGVLKTLK